MKHMKEVKHRQSNYSLGAQFKKPVTQLFPLFKSRLTSVTDTPVNNSSVPTNTSSSCSSGNDENQNKEKKPVPLGDRTKNMEAMILSVMAENNISFSVAPQLVGYVE